MSKNIKSSDENNEFFDQISRVGQKPSLTLRFHQKLIVKNVLNSIKNGYKNLLIGAIARSGKSYLIGSIASHFKNCMILSSVPTETFGQFMGDLFLKFADFQDYSIINPQSSHELKHIKLDKMNIVVVSKQLLQIFILKNTIKKLVGFDVIFFDEHHVGGNSDLSKEIIHSYSSKNTIHIFVTATYRKSINKVDKIFLWNMMDIQLCKKKNVDGLISRHGSIVKSLLKDVDELNVYKLYPNMIILSTLFDKRIINKFKQILKIKTFNIPMDKLFQNKWAIQSLLDYISKTIYKRINFISYKYKSKTEISSDNFGIQLWFLPPKLINDTSQLLVKICDKHPIMSRFGFFIINSHIEDKINDIKKMITSFERKYKREKKLGLIILSGNMLTLGISLPKCHYVFMLNNINNIDKITQSIYRCLTENEGKKFGFVIDLNINRIIEAMLTYTSEPLNNENKIKYLIKNNIINVDIDLVSKREIINKLVNNYDTDPINEYQNIIRFSIHIIPVINYIINSLTKDRKNIEIISKLEKAKMYSLIRVNRLVNTFIDNIHRYEIKESRINIIDGIYSIAA